MPRQPKPWFHRGGWVTNTGGQRVRLAKGKKNRKQSQDKLLDLLQEIRDRPEARAYAACFREWVQAVSAALRIKHVAMDGTTLRGSRSAKRGPLHLVSAWATAQPLSLGHVAVEAKSNESTALPELLELLDLTGALVTIAALGCQKAIARKVLDQGGEYALTVKDNQEHLLEDLQLRFEEAFATNFAGLEYDT